jgi:hypothetical protein
VVENMNVKFKNILIEPFGVFFSLKRKKTVAEGPKIK